MIELMPGLEMNDVMWWIFCLLAGYFLYSIRKELTGLREDISKTEDRFNSLAVRVAQIQATCQERMQHCMAFIKGKGEE